MKRVARNVILAVIPNASSELSQTFTPNRFEYIRINYSDELVPYEYLHKIWR